MLSTLGVTKKSTSVMDRFSACLILDDGLETAVHIVRYRKNACAPRLVTFEEPVFLLDWCRQNNVTEALVGGFFLTSNNTLLGEHWVAGHQKPAIKIQGGWEAVRGSVHIDKSGDLSVGPRKLFAKQPHYLMHAGPLLLSDGEISISEGLDNEGFSDQSSQFDSDISIGRYPRSAVGYNDEYIWSVVCDGRSQENCGLTLTELARLMLNLGASHALNLDGGASASQISDGKLRNYPRGLYETFPKGRPILSAIIF